MLKHSITRWRPLAAATGLLALGGCATGPDVRVDYDRSADFAAYKTFAFASPLGTDRGGYQSIVSQHLKAATQPNAKCKPEACAWTRPHRSCWSTSARR